MRCGPAAAAPLLPKLGGLPASLYADRMAGPVPPARGGAGAVDLAALLPTSLEPQFTTRDLATARGVRVAVAQKMAYCYKAMEVLRPVGHRQRSVLYERA